MLTGPTHWCTVGPVQITTRTDRANLSKRVLVAPGLVMPDVVTVYGEDVAGYDVEIEVVPNDGRLVARDVRVLQREGGPAVTGEALRSVPVATLTKYAARHAMAHEYADGVTSMTVRVFNAEVAEHLRSAGPVSSTLEAVAYLYRVAVLMGEPPTKAVEETLGLPRSTAGRWVALARREGHLGPAEGPGKAGG